MRPLVAGVFVAIMTMVSVSACDDATASPAKTVDPTEQFSIRSAAAAGDPLANGLAVAEGTTLIGKVMPIGVSHFFNGEPVVDDGWVATFLIDDDPEAAVEAYMRQAANLGLARIPVAPSTSLAGLTTATCTTDPQPYVVNEAGRYRCAALATGGTEGAPITMAVQADRGAIGPAAFVNQLTLQYSTLEIARSALPARLGIAGPAPILPDNWATVVRAGEEIPDNWPYMNGIEIVDGSLPAGPLGMSGCEGTALTIEVTGDPLAVFDAYQRQYATRTGTPSDAPLAPPEPLAVADGSTLYRAYPGGIGGESLKISLVLKPGERTWMTMESCND
ncbi:MAG TPA: hypothetical protein VJM33_02320 [Microthrixaceae bacterium]|nr:hypothetical protein [Microthrixaceae bacterium]